MSRAYRAMSLLDERRVIGLDGLAQELCVTPKTVLKVLDSLNLAFGESAAVSHEGSTCQLTIFDPVAYDAVRAAMLVSSRSLNEPLPRQARIYHRISRALTPVVIDQLAQELSVSRSTVRADLVRLRELIAPYGLEVEGRTNAGVQIRGSEVSQRLVLIEKFYDLVFEPSPLEPSVIQDVVDTAHCNGLQISAIESVVHWFTVMVDRVAAGSGLFEVPQDLVELQRHPAFAASGTLVALAERLLGQPIPEGEAYFMTLPMIAMRGPHDIRALSGFISEEENERLALLILDKIEQGMGISLTLSGIRSEFIRHLGFLTNRMRFGVQISEDTSGLKAPRYPLAFEMASTARQVLVEETRKPVTEAETALLAAYFQIALEKLKEHARRQLRIAAIYPHGPVEGHLLQKQIEDVLPRTGEIVPFAQDEATAEALGGFDLAVVRQGVSIQVPIPHLRVSLAFDGDELRRAIDAISIQGSLGERVAFGGASWLATLLMPGGFVRLESAGRGQMLDELLETLEADGRISPEFTQAIRRREALSSTQIRDGLSFPHVSSGSSALILAAGVSAKGSGVVVLAGLPEGGSKDDSTPLVGLYQEIMRLAQDPELIRRISRLETEGEFKSFVSAASARGGMTREKAARDRAARDREDV